MKKIITVGLLALFGAMANAEEFRITGDPAKGAEIYKMYCALCHGETGAGDGIGAANLPPPKPRALNDKEYMDTLTDEHIFKIIKEGGTAVGKSMFMTAWGAVLKTDEAIHDVSAYVRSLAQ
jgi:cytochrome c oxidase cbb3-type subunit 3